MAFADMRNFKGMVPPDKLNGVEIEADYNTLRATVQSFPLEVTIFEREPYSRISLKSTNSPVSFRIQLNFAPTTDGKTDFSIGIEAELNMMMRMMVGSKIQPALDALIDSISQNA